MRPKEAFLVEQTIGVTPGSDSYSSPPGSAVPALAAENISKQFGHVTALSGVSLSVAPGEVLALMGDNGAGKSTLVKILSGVQAPDGGTIRVDGAEVVIGSPVAARTLGIETVYQDLALADDLSAPENLFLGREHKRRGLLGRAGVLDNKRMEHDATEQMRLLGARIPDYNSPVGVFSGGQRQSVAIARASIWASRVIIMDEPTAALGLVQTAQVADLIRRTRDSGIAVIVISHSVPFVFDVADRIVVMRLGRSAATLPVVGTTHEDIVAAITGATVPGKKES
ncbi:sugar ABC transporter ATP-binding protein [Subtercola boreus]|uniref:Sugar ABC transporter ATP-binding protein n=1 Tax=Subtercola boreus TaxID=120213 RepID=A0A3E0W7H0_9MICO|nr:ATP-binding cassette domain-containing protein [Subtercola boreus]RFA17793.1 sugar ABC transporter ATP-binding protein [Subtercola boreus]RFA17825.1 sugar ABC transporter ATP-binding protein [Subtercola boreus]RFA24579.1 sugar ABC transporter ATP-binding protein [Subtercola boreus]